MGKAKKAKKQPQQQQQEAPALGISGVDSALDPSPSDQGVVPAAEDTNPEPATVQAIVPAADYTEPEPAIDQRTVPADKHTEPAPTFDQDVFTAAEYTDPAHTFDQYIEPEPTFDQRTVPAAEYTTPAPTFNQDFVPAVDYTEPEPTIDRRTVPAAKRTKAAKHTKAAPTFNQDTLPAVDYTEPEPTTDRRTVPAGKRTKAAKQPKAAPTFDQEILPAVDYTEPEPVNDPRTVPAAKHTKPAPTFDQDIVPAAEYVELEFVNDQRTKPAPTFEQDIVPAAEYIEPEFVSDQRTKPAPTSDPRTVPAAKHTEPEPAKKVGMFKSLFGKKEKEPAVSAGWGAADLTAGGWADTGGGTASGWGAMPAEAAGWSAADPGAGGDWSIAPDPTAAYGMPYGSAKASKSPGIRTAATTPWTMVPDEISIAEEKKKSKKGKGFKFWMPSHDDDEEEAAYEYLEDPMAYANYMAATSGSKPDKKTDKKTKHQQSSSWGAGVAMQTDWAAPTSATGWDQHPPGWTQQPTGWEQPRPTGKTPKTGRSALNHSLSDWNDLQQYQQWEQQATKTPVHTSKKTKEKSSKGQRKEEAMPETAFFGNYPAYYRTPKTTAMHTPAMAYATWGAPMPGPSKTPKTPAAAFFDPYQEMFGIASSQGAGLEVAQRSLYGRHRPSAGRILWGMPPNKDPRVQETMMYIQDAQIRNEFCILAMHHFLSTRTPGCFFVNGAYRLPDRPSTPGVDYMTYDQLQMTCDRTIQQSLMYTDPSTFVLVFVFLVSPTGNSMAIWRRKLPMRPELAHRYAAEIEDIKYEIKSGSYRILVDTPPDLAQGWNMTPALGLGMGLSTPFPTSNMGFMPQTPAAARGAWFSTGR